MVAYQNVWTGDRKIVTKKNTFEAAEEGGDNDRMQQCVNSVSPFV